MHKLYLPVVGVYGCAFSRIFHVTVWSVLFSFSFQMCSLSDVADDLWLSLTLVISCFELVLGYSYIDVFPHCVGLCDGGLVDDSFLETIALQRHNVLFLQLHSFICSPFIFSLLCCDWRYFV